MPITHTIRPRMLHKLVERVRSTKLRISGTHRGRGLMVEWQFMLSRGSRSKGSLSNHNYSRLRVSMVVTTRSIRPARSARGDIQVHVERLQRGFLHVWRDGASFLRQP